MRGDFAGLEFGEAAGESEVGKFYSAGLGLKDVARFDVAMNDIELQCVPQDVGKLSGDADDFGKGQRAVDGPMFERGAALSLFESLEMRTPSRITFKAT